MHQKLTFQTHTNRHQLQGLRLCPDPHLGSRSHLAMHVYKYLYIFLRISLDRCKLVMA